MSRTNYAVPPGEYLDEWMDQTETTRGDIAWSTDWDLDMIDDVLHGRVQVTEDIADQLDQLTGIPADSWLRYEAAYRADLIRLTGTDETEEKD